MSDWQVGDLAVCVDDDPLPGYATCGVVKGHVYKVTGLGGCPDGPCLWLSGIGPSRRGNGRLARRFRKILPDKHEACESEFAILLKLSKHRVKA